MNSMQWQGNLSDSSKALLKIRRQNRGGFVYEHVKCNTLHVTIAGNTELRQYALDHG